MRKAMANHILRPLTALILAACICSCGRVKDISVTSVGLESFQPKGLTSAEAVLLLGIHNPSIAFTVAGVEGDVSHDGRQIAVFSADTIAVDRKCDKVYALPCRVSLKGGTATLSLLPKLAGGKYEGLSANVNARVKLRSGMRLNLKFKDLDIEEMMNGALGEAKPDEIEKL